MAEGDIGAIVDNLIFYSAAMVRPHLIHISGNIFAFVYTNTSGLGVLQTVEIDAAGNIGAAVIDTLIFTATSCNYARIIHRSGTVYAIVYSGVVNIGTIVTVNISDAGALEAAVIDLFVFDAGTGISPFVVEINTGRFAVSYVGPGNHGQVCTIGISDAGVIQTPVIDAFEFDATYCGHPRIVNVVGSVFAIASTTAAYSGKLTTLAIDPAGQIGASSLDTLVFYAAACSAFQIILSSLNVVAIVFKGDADDGFLVTIGISDAGDIDAAPIETWEYDTINGSFPKIIHISGNVFCIAHDTGGTIKNLLTFSISDAGDIDTTLIDSFALPTTGGSYLDLIHVANNVYAVAFRGPSNYGNLTTLDIETVIQGFPGHMPLMGIG